MYPYDPRYDDSPFEHKGGKPNQGTPKDKRLKDNQDDGKPMPGGKKPFPGAAEPFGKKPKGGR